jgi:hypothetical protein
MIAAISSFASWLWGIVAQVATWALDVGLWIPRKTYELLLDALGYVLGALPVPEVIALHAGALSAISGPVLWWLSILQVPAGLSMVLAAYGVRFVIRRLPFIG